MAEKQAIPLQFAVPLAAVALIGIGYFGFRTLSGPSYPKVATSTELRSTEEQLALKSGGDFSKLSPDDQKTLDTLTRGHGQKFIEINYAKLSSSGGK
jgi:hypothetical protein